MTIYREGGEVVDVKSINHAKESTLCTKPAHGFVVKFDGFVHESSCLEGSKKYCRQSFVMMNLL